jgi:ligand-binding SRPBCC domain-containing protein
MNKSLTLHFESQLFTSPERVWEWITSLEGIKEEMWPFFRMTFPKGVRSINDIKIEPGICIFRSYIFLFGILPIDYSDMTLITLDRGKGFIEQSPMGSMELWRHERNIMPHYSESKAVILIDQLTFRPRIATRFVGWFIRQVFIHRHNVLKKNFNRI